MVHDAVVARNYAESDQWTEKTPIYASLSMSGPRKAKFHASQPILLPLSHVDSQNELLGRGHLSSIFIIHARNNPINLKPESLFSIIYTFMCVCIYIYIYYYVIAFTFSSYLRFILILIIMCVRSSTPLSAHPP